ncbi:MAG: glycosyltransferase [Promethearchaeota archaeon]
MNKEKTKLWIFTFEYAGIIKVGGLGEVPANQAKHLSNDFEITVFIPAHGQVNNLKNTYNVEKLSIKCRGKVPSSSSGGNESESRYKISLYKVKIENINIILLAGENSFTSNFLDDPVVYNPDTLKEKICLFSIGTHCYLNYLISEQRSELPDIVHLHDYHAVFPYIGIKQALHKIKVNVYSIITIHLLTWPRYDIEYYYRCKIDNSLIKVSLMEGSKYLTLKEIFMMSKNSESTSDFRNPPSVEQIGALVCDIVTTVSQAYLISDIIPNCGKDLIGFKSDFIYNGCDWIHEDIYQEILLKHGNELRKILKITDDRNLTFTNFKDFLLTYKISNLESSPLIRSKKVFKVIADLSDGDIFMKNGKIKAFANSGPLVITTGRMSQQKGFETIFDAIPEVIKAIPDAKFLCLIIPTDYSFKEIKSYSQIVKKYPDNLRIIFGVAKDIFYLAHLSADVYCALSRWEPFGINALEAMASKIPIIATQVGGFQETIVDVRNFWEIGTGILIDKDSPSQFADALISFFLLAIISNRVKEVGTIYETETFKLVNQIPDETLKSLVLLDPDFYLKIKQNCSKRVENNFRWKKVSEKLAVLYTKITELHSNMESQS